MNLTIRRWRPPLVVAMLLLVLLLGSAPGARAWGGQGHRITGLVAERLLTADARAGLRALVGDTDLATLSLFLDRQKDVLAERIPHSREWHYDNRPVCDAQARQPDHCPDGHCASAQITRHYRRLIDPRSTRDERRFAVQVLVHLVGDVHQPLHASDHDDRGGNDVRVSFRLPNGQQRRTNLHAAWDTDFVRAAFQSADERQIARELVEQAGATVVRQLQQGAPAQWLAESHALARAVGYGRLPGFACANDGTPGDAPPLRVPLDAAYIDQATAVVPKQLLRAGARIAYLLNRAFAR